MNSISMAWVYLLVAGGFEILTTTIFRYTDGLTRIVPTVAFFAFGLVSFFFLNKSLSGIPLGTAYAVWTGIGAAGTALVGITAYGEPATAVRVLLLAGLVACIVGLKLVAPK